MGKPIMKILVNCPVTAEQITFSRKEGLPTGLGVGGKLKTFVPEAGYCLAYMFHHRTNMNSHNVGVGCGSCTDIKCEIVAE